MKVLIYGKQSGFVAWTWKFWANLHRNSFDLIIPVESADDLAEKLRSRQSLFEQDQIIDLQIWSHGSPGHIHFGGDAVCLDALGELLHPTARFGSLIWIRTCKTGQDERGMRDLSGLLQAKVIAYQKNIGPLQRGRVFSIVGKPVQKQLGNFCFEMNP